MLSLESDLLDIQYAAANVQSNLPLLLLLLLFYDDDSSADIVQYVARYGVYHGHMASLLGRNAVFGYEQFSLSADNVICGHLDLGSSRSEMLSTYRAASLFEFLMLRHGILAIHAD